MTLFWIDAIFELTFLHFRHVCINLSFKIFQLKLLKTQTEIYDEKFQDNTENNHASNWSV